MKKQLMIPLLAAPWGAAAFLLRLWQNRTGFEPDTGLPIPGAPAGMVLLAALLVWAVCLGVLVFRLPQEGPPALPRDFPLPDARLLALPVAGVLLMALSGLADLYEGLGMGNLLARLQSSADPYGAAVLPEAGLDSRPQLLLGGLALVSAGAAFSAMAACRGERRDQETYPAAVLLLVPPVALVVRLVLIYRLDSVNPALGAYYVELLALVFLTLAFYRLSSFAFQAGRTRRFALYAGAAIVLSLAALADGGPHLSSPLLYGGCSLYLLGVLALRLSGPVVPVPEEPEEENGGEEAALS